MDNPWLRRRPLHLAHQGGALEAPSSTLYACATALANGAHALELDVHATADGHLVVIHDATVDRTTDGSGAVAELSLAQLQRLDAAYRFTAGGGHPWRGVATGRREPPAGFSRDDFRVPLLSDVLAAFPQAVVNIDIKATAPAVAPYEDALAAVLERHGRRADDTMVGSFHDAALDAFRALASPVSTSAGPSEVLAFFDAVQGGGPGVALAHPRALQVPDVYGDVTVVTSDLVRAAHRHDLAVHVWTINDATAMRRLLDLGVDGVVTDRPTVLRDVLAGYPEPTPRI